jgi:SHS family lactate transporter-like MFS transporter
VQSTINRFVGGNLLTETFYAVMFRWSLPETNHFLVMKAEREAKATQAIEHLDDDQPKSRTANMRAFGKEAGYAIKKNWVLLAYMVVVMTGFNSISHGSQDLYPTFLKNQAGMSATQTTVITVIGQIGALIGSTTIGYLSTYFGRRLVMMIACVFGGAIVPAYILPRNLSLIASVFFEQVFVGGVWGPIPIHLIELSPPALRSLTVGLTYQLGNLASSASATIESVIGERFPLPPTAKGVARFDYGKVIGKYITALSSSFLTDLLTSAIFMGAVWAYILFWVFFGPEMSQQEREEEALLAKQYEDLRKEGVSLQKIGAGRAKALGPGEQPGMNEKAEEKAAYVSNHIERV